MRRNGMADPARIRPLRMATALALGALAGCARPAVSLKPPAFQDDALAARDWTHVAESIATGLEMHGLLACRPWPGTTPPPGRVFVIRNTAPGSTFLVEVARDLTEEIIRRGGVVVPDAANALVVNLAVDVIQWGPDGKPLGGSGTLAGSLAAVGLGISNAAPFTPGAVAGLAVGAGLVSDALVAMTPNTRTEAIWDATIADPTHVIAEIRAPLYIPPADIPLYASATQLAPRTSFTPAPALAAVTLRYR